MLPEPLPQDPRRLTEAPPVQALPDDAPLPHDALRWRARWTVAKYQGDWTGADIDAGRAGDPAEVLSFAGNLALYGGVSCLWECLLGNGTATAGQALTYFSNAQAAIGVGDSSTAEAATQTNLQAATNKLRKAMDATFPQHTDGATAGAATVTFRATFGGTEANFAWNEWIVANSTTDGVGRALNRKVQALGTKTAGTSWQFSVSLTIG
jgi:hypothetical protein